MTVVRRLFPAALLLVVFGADALVAQAGRVRNAWTSPCTLSVVLVTFKDTTGQASGDTYDYGARDLPHGYSVNSTTGALEPGTSSYTMDDFERMFSGGYRYSVNGEPDRLIPAFTHTQIVADNNDGVRETLPEVFGSLRHYFQVISGGDFELRVRILNLERNGYPVWVQLPQTKGYYADRFDQMREGDLYWNDAYAAMRDSVRAWGLDATAYTPPDTLAGLARRLRHKVLYLYSGAQFSDPSQPIASQLHPQADKVTARNPTGARSVGFRYVAGERIGSGGRTDAADRFGAIGIHAHEVGHLVALRHPDGPWRGTEVYTTRTATCANGLTFGRGGRMAGWGTMQTGSDGPVVEGTQPNSSSSYKYAYPSCPNPYNPIYLRHLAWHNWETIAATQENKVIRPGLYYFIQGNDGSEIAVELRTAEGFGRYTGWYRFDQAPGLMIWKRTGLQRPRLVPADNRSVYDATKNCPPKAGSNHPPCNPATGFTGPITEGLTPRTFNSSTVYPWIDRISDPFGAKEDNGLRSTFLPLPTHRNGIGLPAEPTLAGDNLRPVITDATDDTHLRRNRYYCVSNNDEPSRIAFRNIRVTRDAANPATGSALVDIYFNHWVGPIDGMETWSDTVYVGGDVTIESGASVTITSDTAVRFLSPVGADANGRPELIVQSGASLTVGTGVTFGTVDRTDMYGLRIETGGTATLNGVTLPEGTHSWSGQTGPAALRLATFGSSSYTAIEGGDPVSEGPVGLAEDPAQASRRTRVTVELTPAPSARVRIPVEVTSGSSGYKVVDLDSTGLLFRPDSSSASFVIRAERDADTVDASIGLSFGALPAGVLGGVPSTSTVTIYDTPNAPTGLTATPGHGQMTLRWDNPDNSGISGWQYFVRPVGPAQGTWTTIDPSGASTTEGTVPNLTNGKEYMFRVRAYTRGYGLTSQSVEAVPTGLRATAYNGAVGLDWVDPEIAGLAGWRSRHRPVLRDGKWSPFTRHGGGAGTHVVRNLTNDQKYRFEVQGLNAAGEALDRKTCPWSGGRLCTWQAVATPLATLPDPPRVIVLTAPDTVWFAEDRTDSVATLSTDPEDAAVTWSRAGADAGLFEVRGDTLHFQSPPDFEAPVDADEDNFYQVTLTATDAGEPAASASHGMTVAVTNKDEPGEVSVSGTLSLSGTTMAAVDSQLTASLSDPDGGVRGIEWAWEGWSLTAPSPGWQPLDPGEDSTTYTPSRSDIGARLRVRATYADGHGPGKSAEDTSIERVVDVPGAPGDLRPAAGDASVRLTWEGAVSNGSAISSYQHRRRPDAGGADEWTSWATITDADDTPDPNARALTVSSLSNGTEYTLEVRAVNGVGPGVAADTTATPMACLATVAGPDSVSVRERAPGDSVIAVFTVSGCGGSAVTANRWEITGADVETRRDTLQIDGSGQVSFRHEAPDYEGPTDQDFDRDHEVQVRARVGTAWSAPRALVVTVTNEDDPGTFTFSGPPRPRVGETVHATLADEDGGAGIDEDNEAHGWRWEPPSAPLPPPGASGSVSLLGARYKVPLAALGERVTVTVVYDDAHGPDKTARDSTGVVRANVPEPPGDLQAEAGAGQVELTWTAAADNGAAVDRYEVRYRDGPSWSGRDWRPVAGGGSARDTTVTGLMNSTEYVFQVRAHNAEGDGRADSVKATPRACAATLSGPDSVSVRERAPADSVIAAFAVADCHGSAVTANRWEITGADVETRRDTLQIDASGQVSFKHRAPDYETPTDQDRDHDHEVQVRARVGAAWSAPRALVVSIANRDDPGRVTMTPSPPRVGRSVTAQLVDEDGNTGNTTRTWTWGRVGTAGGQHHIPSVILTTNSYKPKPADAGYRLRATVSYEDAHGPGKTASGQSAQPVRGVAPGPPKNLSAASGDRRVRLTWSAADDSGSAIDRYEVRRGSGSWTAVPGGGSARDTTVTGLSNGTGYTFQVRAHNAEGDGPPAAVTATPATVPDPPDLSAEPGHRQVALTWTAAAANGAEVDLYEVRYRSGSSWAGRDWHPVAGEGAARDTTLTGLANGTSYTFQLRAHNRQGYSDPSEVTATPATVPGTPDLTATPGYRQVALTWTAAAANGAEVDLYEVRYHSGSGWTGRDWHPVAGEGAARDTTLTGLSNGTVYTFELRAHNREGYGAADTEPATPVNGDPSVSGPDAPAVPERTRRVGTYTGSDPDPGDVVSWSLGDTDASHFELKTPAVMPGTRRELHFQSAPNFDVRRSYSVRVRVRDREGAADSVQVAVSVTDVDEPGTVTVTPSSPTVGDTLTATLIDTDGGVDDTTWVWTREGSQAQDGATGQSYSVRSSKQPVVSADAGSRLRVTVEYDDNQGDDKSATATTGVVQAARPGPPRNVRTDPGDRQVTLRWAAAVTGGASIDRYEYRYRSGSSWTGRSWITVSGGGAKTVTVSPLSNGTSYTFQVRAHNRVGYGDAVEVAATPATVPGVPPDVEADPGDGQVELSWGAASANGSEIEYYQTQHKRTVGGSWSGWTRVGGADGDGSARSRTITGLTNGQEYTFQVRAKNEPGYGAAGQDRATPVAPNRRPTVRGPETASVAENGSKKVGTYTGTDPDAGDTVTWSLSGTDPGHFELKTPAVMPGTRRELHFRNTPDHEARSSYSVRVRVRDGGGLADSVQVAVTVSDVNEAPVITGPSRKTIPENRTGSVATYTAADPEDDEVAWSLTGTDDDDLRISSGGVLRFGSTPNYERPTDFNTNNIYSFRVVATDDGSPEAASSKTVRVTVTNADDPGVVTLDPGRPKVGEHVTATLTDEDGGITGPTWSWSTESGAAGQASSVQSFRYTVPASDVGKRLEASVGYTDNHGSGKSASGRSTGTVRANTPKAPPGFNAVRGNAQVALSWRAADGRGAAIDRYDIRGAGSGWTAVPGAGSARDTTVTGLTNGTSYAFEVRAHNSAGDGAASSDSATPATVPGAPTSLATSRGPESGKATISWEAAPDNGSPIKRYQYRRRIGTTGTWRGWFTVSGGGGARSRTVTGLGDFTSYTWEVRAENEVGFGPAASIFQERLGPRGTAGDAEDDNLGDNEGEPDTPMDDESDDTATAKPVAGGLAGPAALHVTTAPNPFNSSTTLHFQLPEASPVTLTVYNVAGQVVAELARGEVLEAGLHEREWYGTDDHGRAAASGLYLYRLIAAEGVRVGKLALIR